MGSLLRSHYARQHTEFLTVPPNQRWSLDFFSDALVDGRRFRILCVIDDFSRECLATIVDNSLSGERVARELDAIAEWRGYPLMIVSDNGTELDTRIYLSDLAPRLVVGWWQPPSDGSAPA